MRRQLPETPLLARSDVGSPRIESAIALSPAERQRIVQGFFAAHPGSLGDGPIGLGRAILDFQGWEVSSGRITGAGGSDWWRAVNGMMVLDIQAAASECGAVGAGVDAWRTYASAARWAQAFLWRAHQVSLHAAIGECDQFLAREPRAEREFAAIVIDIVDRTALAGRPTDSSELALLTERFYPRTYPVEEGAIPPLERMRERTADALRAPDGTVFGDVGMDSRRWR